MHFISLLLIILVEGFVTISVEILSIRQLLPFVGNSVVVTSLIIGAFLLFLALGYRQGGFYFERFNHILKRNFTIAAGLIGVGLSYPFINLFFFYSNIYISHHILVTLSVYLLVVTAPIVYILGQTVPITTNLISSEEWVGAISGKVLFLSTLGSFLGATATSLILLNYLGVAWTVFLNCLALALLTLLLLRNTIGNWLIVVGLLAALALAYHYNVLYEKRAFAKTTLYANYQITSFGDMKFFMLNRTVSSVLKKDNRTARYIEDIKQKVFNDLRLRNKKILVIGAGGFSFTAQGTFDNDVTYVDIDPNIKGIAENGFVSKVNGHFIARDGRAFLRQHPDTYDAIVFDVFESYISIPSHMLTVESMLTLRNALHKNGWVFFNLVANPMFTDQYSKTARNTIRSVFPSCIISTYQYKNMMNNLLFSCHKQDNEDVKSLYTDNMNRSTLDFFRSDMMKIIQIIR